MQHGGRPWACGVIEIEGIHGLHRRAGRRSDSAAVYLTEPLVACSNWLARSCPKVERATPCSALPLLGAGLFCAWPTPIDRNKPEPVVLII